MPTFDGFQFPMADLRNAGLEELRAYVMQLQNALVQMQRDQKYYLNNMDTDNISEVGGWRASPDEMKSKDGDVGMSTEDTAADDVRFWAGSTDKNTAPWRVTKAGKMKATGATIESAAGYPKIVMDPEGNLFAAYSDADNYVVIDPQYNGSPSYVIYAGGLPVGIIYEASGAVNFVSVPSRKIEIVPGGDLDLGSTGGNVNLEPTGNVTLSSWSKLLNLTTSRTLQQALNDKLDKTGASTIFETVDGKIITVVNGAVTNVS